ncbi:GNAT family N-acetyltransferase [Cellulomonas fengjieae]|uniref:GNAT family N-acetyltransferase n=1 Tax=Cellulomonas fengjieae TaxID=2819978 RepID=UPI001AAF76AB|nr:GNAT family protein [Cellulomonas fengjieae]MBO3102351.1 GNAT family N-acetyltransferase [Cellulomonas fengjieae]
MKVSLSPWSTADSAALAAAVQESPELAVQLGDVLETSGAARGYIEHYLTDDDDETVAFAIRVDGLAVGHVALSHVDRRHDSAWASYWVTASLRRRGLATRALATVAAHGFETLGLFRLELGHRVNNPASCRVATGAGFSAEGIERSKLRYGSDRYDVETHARLTTDPAPPIALLPVLESAPPAR